MTDLIFRPLRWLLVISIVISLWSYGFITMLLDSPINLSKEDSNKISFTIPKGSNLDEVNVDIEINDLQLKAYNNAVKKLKE